jgi:hypothetical protein
MFIEWTCSECGQPLRASRKHAGKKARCPDCKSISTVPEGIQSAAAVEACHFCGADLNDAQRLRFAEALEAFEQQDPSPAARPQDQPELARLLPAGRFGVYPTCDDCHESTVQNQEELREEREVQERQRWSCLLLVIAVVILWILASLAGYLRQHSRHGSWSPSRGGSASPVGLCWPCWEQ